MHKLQRGHAPVCLSHYQHGRDNWSAVTPEDKVGIWVELEAMQGRRCAYCESDIADGRRHIEHFVQKSADPKGTFLWSNLFGSCMRQDSCGIHKDHQGCDHEPRDLIKPDVDDPDDFLVFSANGTVRPRQDLPVAKRKRAAETIRVFNLDGVLQAIRRAELQGYVQTAEAFAEMAEQFPPEDWLPLLEQEMTTTSTLPFATAIRHVLTRRSVGN